MVKQNILKTNLKNRRFGKLKVSEIFRKTSDRHKEWLCKCDCGANHWVLGTNLNRGLTKSCGKCRK